MPVMPRAAVEAAVTAMTTAARTAEAAIMQYTRTLPLSRPRKAHRAPSPLSLVDPVAAKRAKRVLEEVSAEMEEQCVKEEGEDQPRSMEPVKEEEDQPRSMGQVKEEEDQPRSMGPMKEEEDLPRSMGPVKEEEDQPRSMGPVKEDEDQPRSMGPVKEGRDQDQCTEVQPLDATIDPYIEVPDVCVEVLSDDDAECAVVAGYDRTECIGGLYLGNGLWFT
jgi:hypothetical protein